MAVVCLLVLQTVNLLPVVVQDLDAQLQRALNVENYAEAQAVRARREKVDQGLIRLQVCFLCIGFCCLPILTSRVSGLPR